MAPYLESWLSLEVDDLLLPIEYGGNDTGGCSVRPRP